MPRDLLEITEAVLPAVDLSGAHLARGQFHDVVVVPEIAAVRIARRQVAACQLPRRTALLRRLGQVGLPFLVPEPLTEALVVGDRVAAAVSWIPGKPLPNGVGEPEKLGALLSDLRNVPLADLDGLLDVPHAYAGGDDWLRLLLEEVIPALPARHRPDATRWVNEAAALPDQAPTLVHGDLAGENIHWDADGNLVGVLDWDLAQPFDQAVDAACLATHGWDNVREAVSSKVYDRARIWWRTFALEQLASAMVNGEPSTILDSYLATTVRWLDAEFDRG